jgi:hypothetical protein
VATDNDLSLCRLRQEGPGALARQATCDEFW